MIVTFLTISAFLVTCLATFHRISIFSLHMCVHISENVHICCHMFVNIFEEFHIVCLDTKNKIIATHQISVGTLDASLVHPREVFRPAIKDSASSILLVHNHPSGDPTPSQEDLSVTDRLEESGVTLGIQVLDHIVLGTSGGVSIREFR